jgi:hypothetical protein
LSHAVIPILAAPVFVLGLYAFVRFWPVDDEEASFNRHSFIEADGQTDLPSTPPTLVYEKRLTL